MSDQDRTADASNEDHYVWWVENSPTDHSHHVVHGTKSSIKALRQRVEELAEALRDIDYDERGDVTGWPNQLRVMALLAPEEK